MMTQPLSIKLCVKDEQDNLFVRLSARTVKDLLGDDRGNSFLPLSISFGDTTVYTSWNGGMTEYDDGAIEVPSFLLSGLSPLPTVVEVKVLKPILPCLKVHVEPVSTKDWELLQCDSEVLQQGGFLQQVSVVYSHQRLHLKLDNDYVELLVNSIESSHDDKIICGLLRQDTEVIIAPRKRETNTIVDWSLPQTLIPSLDDWDEPMLQLHKTMKLEPLSVAPGCVLVNETVWNSDYSWALVQTAPPDAQQEENQKRLVQVVCNKSVPEGKAVLHKWVRQDLGSALYWGSIRLRPTCNPKELSLEEISLVPIEFKSTEILPAFRKPRRVIHDAKVVTNDSTGVVVLPLHGIFEASWLAEKGPKAKGSMSYFRLVDSETESSSAQLYSILTCNQETRDRLAELCTRTKTDAEPELLSPPEHENLLCPLSAPVVSSHAWAESVLNSLRKHDQLWVTIWGDSGSGKSHSALLLSAIGKVSQHAPGLYLDCKRLQETTSSLVEILTEIDSVFELAAEVEDCIIVFDDIDLITPNLLDGGEQDSSARVEMANPIAVSQSKVIADRILQLIEATRSSRVSILVTSTSLESLHSSFHDCMRIPRQNLEVPTLSADDRIRVLEQLVRNGSSSTAPISETVGQTMDGFRPRDLEKIASRVRQKLRARRDGLSIDEAVSVVLDGYTPLSHLALNDLDHSVSTTWDMIGGLSSVKSKLESVVLHPVKYKLIYEKARIKLPRGILLFGPPGCGKSAIVPAFAQFCKFPLISCKGPEIFDKYIGASEAKVRELFKRASDVAPSILFLDELDSLAPRRGSDHTGVTDRVVNQLLTFLDGVEDNSVETVYVIAATSRPDKVDAALLRPGRLEQHLFVGPPTTEEDLFDLFSKLCSEWNLTDDCQEKLSSIENAREVLSLVIRGTGSIFPADIKAVFVTAHVSAVHRALEEQKPEEIKEVKICLDDLKSALQGARPSVSGKDALEFKEIYQKFQGKKKQSNHSHGKSPEQKTTLR